MDAKKAALEEFLKTHRMKRTSQREQIFNFLLGWEKHMSPEEIFRQLREKYPRIGRATVYRTLKILARADLAASVEFGDGLRKFEHNRSHHDHLICLHCKRSIEFYSPRMERLQDRIARRHGFQPQRHRLEIFGLCQQCREAKAS